MTKPEPPPLRLAVIGGGLTGAALIIHAARAATARLVIDLIEPAEIARGIAYSTRDPSHRINVPSNKMSLFPDDPDHLTRWLFVHGVLPDVASTDDCGHHYVPRSAYGDYGAATLRETLAATTPQVELRHQKTRAMALRRDGADWIVELSSGETVVSEVVALCGGHAAPKPPSTVSAPALQHSGFIANPWGADAFASIRQDESVLIVGTGLTMADVVASLDLRGHRGAIAAISRRGLLALPQGRFLSDVPFLGPHPLPRTALALLRLARARVRDLAPRVGWQPVMDALRFDLHRLWRALPAHEQRRAVRRLLPFWEVHRFRVAPQVHALLEREKISGRLTIETASFVGLQVQGGRLEAMLKRPRREVETRAYDHVVLCTGPGRRLDDDPLITSIVEGGWGRPDAVHLGLAVDDESRLVGADGTSRSSLRALGPITRGSFGEMTGAPDIIKHITRIVGGVVRGG